MKVAICVPYYGEIVRALFCMSLARLMAHVEAIPEATGGRIEQRLFMKPGLLPMVRNELKDEALEWGADWLLWLDADMAFPTETLHQLLLDGQHIAGANYPLRLSAGMAAFNMRDGKAERVATTKEKADKRWLEPVDAMGMGVLLSSAEVFRKVSPRPFRFDYEDDRNVIGEDATFMFEAKVAGYQPYVDHALSWHVGHVVPALKTPRTA